MTAHTIAASMFGVIERLIGCLNQGGRGCVFIGKHAGDPQAQTDLTIGGFRTVSYTHLDVYKRQHQIFDQANDYRVANKMMGVEKYVDRIAGGCADVTEGVFDGLCVVDAFPGVAIA